MKDEDGARITLLLLCSASPLLSSRFSLKLKHIVLLPGRWGNWDGNRQKWQPKDTQMPSDRDCSPSGPSVSSCVKWQPWQRWSQRTLPDRRPECVSKTAFLIPSEHAHRTAGCFFVWTKVIWFPESINKLEKQWREPGNQGTADERRRPEGGGVGMGGSQGASYKSQQVRLAGGLQPLPWTFSFSGVICLGIC